jgi:hypothetical protein
MSKAKAVVTCGDGKKRTFITTMEGECFHYEGKKHTYLLWDEPEGRGFITMVPTWNSYNKRSYVSAPSKWQPKKIVATTWAGTWTWEISDE